MILYLIRHGETLANERHLYCGSSDLPLTLSGASKLKDMQPEYQVLDNTFFITSGMRRTEQSLDVLFGKVPHFQVPGLREINFGKFELQSYDELKDDPEYQAWITGNNFRNVPPGGESGAHMAQRVLESFRKIVDYNHNLIIVTHGGVISVIMKHLFPQAGNTLYQWQPQPGHGYQLTVENGNWGYFAIPDAK